MPDENIKFEDLMVDYLSGTISDTNEHLLLDLLNSDSKYVAKYKEIVKSRAISFIPALENEKSRNYKVINPVPDRRLVIKKQTVFFHYFSRIAAVFLFLLSTSIVSYYFYTDNFTSNKLVSYQTVVPLGSQGKIILPDGTIVWLNSGSTLKYN